MKIEKQFEELARIEKLTCALDENGCEVAYKDSSVVQGGITVIDRPDYNSLNVLRLIICGMDRDTHVEYVKNLMIITANTEARWSMSVDIEDLISFSVATPTQVREAILRAYGKWEAE